MRILGFGPPLPPAARVAFAVEAPTADVRLLQCFSSQPKGLPGPLYDALLRVSAVGVTARLLAGDCPASRQYIASQLVKVPLFSRDLGPAGQQRLDSSRASYAILASGPAGDGRLIETVRDFVWRLAAQVDGLVVDGPAATVWSPPCGGWLAALSQPVTADVASQVTYRAEPRRGVWMRSLGLCKYGQPEVQITLPSDRLMAPAGRLIECVAATLVKQGRVIERTVVLPLDYWGDIVLSPTRDRHYGGPSYSVRVAGEAPRSLDRTLSRLVTARSDLDSTTSLQPDPAALAAAIKRAQAKLPEVVANHPDPEAEAARGVLLRINAGFPFDAPIEYLNLRVLAWGDPIRAVVDCQPMLQTGLLFGQVVGVPVDQVREWLVIGPDGGLEGGFVSALLDPDR